MNITLQNACIYCHSTQTSRFTGRVIVIKKNISSRKVTDIIIDCFLLLIYFMKTVSHSGVFLNYVVWSSIYIITMFVVILCVRVL